MSLNQLQNKTAFIFPDWEVNDKIVALTTTRQNGVSKGNFEGFNIAAHVGDDSECVVRNRESLIQLLDVNVDLQWLEQRHGNDVVEARKGSGILPADAVYSKQAGVACCVTTADCLPVLLTDLEGSMVAAVHAGWRGLFAGVLEQTIESFTCDTREITAWLGPAIGACHFEVGAEVREKFLSTVGNKVSCLIDDCFKPSKIRGKFMANLYGLASIKLVQLGVSNISGGEFCTYCQDNKFYSYRRQTETGRMVSLIYIKP